MSAPVLWRTGSGRTRSDSAAGWDWLWVVVLAGVCTVYAYAAFVRLFQTFTAFVMNLTVNLEPIYGILLAFFIFGDAEKMTTGFYAGASLILGAVLLYPVLSRWSNRRAKETINP
ncbi:EamA family transporter [Siphonobacter sp. BAB-5385]|uniref:EamA family transporter n=1 Tax=Siphonobacter sp. BAB-5385 TaxID=1864822 RepID=UPI0020CEA3C6|nr:EamA family transporter [Siphonobacter sp. BAB-5385]